MRTIVPRLRTPLAALLLVGLVVLASGWRTAEQAAPRWGSWLCRPGQAENACATDLTTTAVGIGGQAKVVEVRVPSTRPVDCFYVYPTVRGDPSGNAVLELGPAEQRAAVTQAARFEEVCRVFAPLYRQTTNGQGNSKLAYGDVAAAWRDYLARDNGGRGVVLIGHSQGAHVLRQLIQREIEPVAARRKLVVSAILLGAGITVKRGSDRGGDFERLPACRSREQTGCVVAYSAWVRTPPPDASYQDVSSPSRQILCVNPAAPGDGGKAPITPAFPWHSTQGIVPEAPGPPPTGTQWISLPNLYTARCVSRGSRAWLLVEPIRRRNEPRPVVQAFLDARGLHAADVNIALETLVSLVRTQSSAWLARR